MTTLPPACATTPSARTAVTPISRSRGDPYRNRRGPAVPVAITTRMRGSVYDLAVTVAVPLGLLLGSFDWRTLPPAVVIVLALVVRSRLRRGARARSALAGHAGATILDLPPSPQQEP